MILSFYRALKEKLNNFSSMKYSYNNDEYLLCCAKIDGLPSSFLFEVPLVNIRNINFKIKCISRRKYINLSIINIFILYHSLCSTNLDDNLLFLRTKLKEKHNNELFMSYSYYNIGHSLVVLKLVVFLIPSYLKFLLVFLTLFS